MSGEERERRPYPWPEVVFYLLFRYEREEPELLVTFFEDRIAMLTGLRRYRIGEPVVGQLTRAQMEELEQAGWEERLPETYTLPTGEVVSMKDFGWAVQEAAREAARVQK